MTTERNGKYGVVFSSIDANKNEFQVWKQQPGVRLAVHASDGRSQFAFLDYGEYNRFIQQETKTTHAALITALSQTLCVDCGYRIGFTDRHGSLGAGNPGIHPDHRYKDWQDCTTCRFAREILTDES